MTRSEKQRRLATREVEKLKQEDIALILERGTVGYDKLSDEEINIMYATVFSSAT